jgi:hypothetical protein
MRAVLVLAAASAALCLALPSEAATKARHRTAPALSGAYAGVVIPDLRTDLRRGNGGFQTGPYRQGVPGDNLPIWRRGFYQGNDPDQNIRLQLMRDPRNYAH